MRGLEAKIDAGDIMLSLVILLGRLVPGPEVL